MFALSQINEYGKSEQRILTQWVSKSLRRVSRVKMEAALPHFHRLTSSRFYQQYAAPPVRISSNYLHDLIPQQHPTLLQQYLAYYNEPLVPLDLSLKSTTPITPPCTPPPSQKRKTTEEPRPEKSPKIFRHFEDNDSKEAPEDKQEKRKLDDDNSNDSDSPEAKKLKFTKQFFDELKTCLPQEEETPSKSGRSSPDVVEIKDLEERPKKSPKPTTQPLKKSKAVRRLMFDEDKTSPVSGTIIRDLAEDETLVVRKVIKNNIIYRTISNVYYKTFTANCKQSVIT